MHEWKKSWCEGAREEKWNDKGVVTKNSKETFKEKNVIEEWGREMGS